MMGKIIVYRDTADFTQYLQTALDALVFTEGLSGLFYRYTGMPCRSNRRQRIQPVMAAMHIPADL